MTKFSNEMRMAVIKELETETSVIGTARKHGVSARMVRRWRADFESIR